MSALRANLRLFWERSSLWIPYAGIYFLVALTVLWDLMERYYTGRSSADFLFLALGVAALAIGLIVGVMQVEILSCPFSLALPGHQGIVRQVVFTVGLAVSASATVIILPHIAPAGRLVLRSWSILSASLVVYLTGVACTYVATAQVLIGIAILAWWFLMLLGSDWGVDAAVTHIVLDFPVSVGIAGSLSAAVAWLCLKRPAWGVRIRVSLRERLSRRWNRGRVGDGTCVGPAGNRLLLNMVRASRGAGAARCIWGALYGWMAPGGGRGQLVLTPIAALACAFLALYFPFIGFLLLMWLPFSYPRPSLYSKLLITGGRRERFLATLVPLIIAGAVWTISVAVSFAAVNLLQAYLPQQARAVDLEQIFPPVNIRLAVFLTALYPLRAFADLAFRGLPVQGTYASIVLVLFVYLPIIITQRWLTGMPLVCVPLAISVSWVVSMYGLYRITMRRDLVWTRPEEWIGHGW